MPTYEYICRLCDHAFDAFQSMKDDSLTSCPSCGKEGLKRLIGGGAGIIFKGSGFYETHSWFCSKRIACFHFG
ncbi:MAG: zinc ribbon domain-containing protein [Opitutaceae bacterium]|nr:zinc ribbon domain-containing protein [Opitutaceae bacterium]